MIKDLSFDSVVSFLKNKEDTVVLFHVRPDADAVGSAFGLKFILEALGSRVYCLSSDEIPNRLRFLTDGIQESSLDTSLPDGFKPSRIISVDCASTAQIGSIFEKFVPQISIDHHGTSQRYSDGYVVPNAAATGEIIYDIAKALIKDGSLKQLPKRFYECIYAAISSDTGGFRYSNTTPDTLIRASEIISNDIDFADINHRLFVSKPMSALAVEAAAIKRLRTYHEGKISVVAIDYPDIVYLGLSKENLDLLIETARAIEGALVAMSVRRDEPYGDFRVSMRSVCDIDVSEICAVFGGGGHVRAAGCSIKATTLEAAVSLVVSETEKRFTL